MAFREVRVYEINEVLRLWLRGEGYRAIERFSSIERKAVCRYVTAATELGLDRGGGEEQLPRVGQLSAGQPAWRSPIAWSRVLPFTAPTYALL